MLYLLIDALLVPLFNSVLVLVLMACSSSSFWKRRGGGGGFGLCRDLGLRLMMNASSYSNNFFRFINGSASHHIWDSVWANP